MSNSSLSDTFTALSGALAHGEPLPLQIARRLGDAIQTGDLEAGTQLPSEPKLAELFKVSRNTAREALRLLVADGLLSSRKGVGTFVQSQRARTLPVETGIEELTSSTEMIRAAGYASGCRDYRLEVVAADTRAAAALGLQLGSFVYRLSRLRLADEQPVIHCVDVLPMARIEEAVMRSYDGSGSLFAFLARCGLTVKVARTVLHPVLPDHRIGEALRLPPDEPVLLLRQTHFDEANEPFLYSENTMHSRFIEFHVRRVPSAHSPAAQGGAAGESQG